MSLSLLAAAAVLCYALYRFLNWFLTPIHAARARAALEAEDRRARETWLAASTSDAVHLSVVIPAYNERERLPVMLREAAAYLSTRSFAFEVLVVDDGSSDGTAGVAEALGRELFPGGELRAVVLARNRGKGGAVREGALRSRGAWVLVADADGATRFSDHARLEQAAMEKKAGVACGSRAHMVGTDAVAKRSALRNLLMRCFHVVVTVVGGVAGVEDTQCGFKLLSKRASAAIFGALHIERWAFDVELLYIAKRLGFPIAEVAVTWHEVAGSKIDIAADSIQMARDIACVRLAYLAGVWTLPDEF